MQKILILFFITILFNGCKKDDKSTLLKYRIVNESNEKITFVPQIPLIQAHYNFDSVIIDRGEDYEMKVFCLGANCIYFPLHNQSFLTVYFNDTTKYMYFIDSLTSLSSGNLLHLEDWSGGKIDDYDYEYQFTFTDADYQEVLSLQ
jgi:hypothetical protein